ncbi:MAG: hypothetical protein AB7I42_24085 [Bradyrhizobium sp.]|uniref:hypothetical protein n=1 Tax=Bradyrhizobium sp. TaxID=376 RepID=UPI003D0EE498
MKLYNVQDAERPMFVVAETFAQAIARWTALVQFENPGVEIDPPQGVQFIADDDELLLSEGGAA